MAAIAVASRRERLLDHVGTLAITVVTIGPSFFCCVNPLDFSSRIGCGWLGVTSSLYVTLLCQDFLCFFLVTHWNRISVEYSSNILVLTMLEMETPWLLELFLFWWRFELWTEIGSSTTCPLRCFFDCSLLSPLALPFPCLLRSKHLDYEKITGPVYVGACHDVPWLFSERRVPLNVSEQCWALTVSK